MRPQSTPETQLQYPQPAPGASKCRDPGLSPGVRGWSLVQTGVFPTHLRSQSEASPAAPQACMASRSCEPRRRAQRPLYPCWPPAGHVRITAEQLGPQDRVPVAPGSSRAHRALGYPLLMRVPSLNSQYQHPSHTDKHSLSPCGLGSPGPRNMRAGPAEAGLTIEPLCLGCERHNQKTLPAPTRPWTSGPGQPHDGPPPALGPLGSQVSGVLTTLVNRQRDLEEAGFSSHPGVLPGPDARPPASAPWARRAEGQGRQDTWSRADATERSRDLLPWMGGQSVQG